MPNVWNVGRSFKNNDWTPWHHQDRPCVQASHSQEATTVVRAMKQQSKKYISEELVVPLKYNSYSSAYLFAWYKGNYRPASQIQSPWLESKNSNYQSYVAEMSDGSCLVGFLPAGSCWSWCLKNSENSSIGLSWNSSLTCQKGTFSSKTWSQHQDAVLLSTSLFANCVVWSPL